MTWKAFDGKLTKHTQVVKKSVKLKTIIFILSNDDDSLRYVFPQDYLACVIVFLVALSDNKAIHVIPLDVVGVQAFRWLLY